MKLGKPHSREKIKKIFAEARKERFNKFIKNFRQSSMKLIIRNKKYIVIKGVKKLRNLKCRSRKSLKEYQKKLNGKDAEISKIKHEKGLSEERLKEQIKSSETVLVSLKEMRTKMSTKMIGESLEVHCENEFNRIRHMAFTNEKFGKDNTVSKSGSKGDYIYREIDEDDNEILSIMFEMKNEDDATATKKKNKDFLRN